MLVLRAVGFRGVSEILSIRFGRLATRIFKSHIRRIAPIYIRTYVYIYLPIKMSISILKNKCLGIFFYNPSDIILLIKNLQNKLLIESNESL